MTPQLKAKQEIVFKLVKHEEIRPPQRFGRDMIEGSATWQAFLEEINNIGPHQSGDFTGQKKSVISYRRKVDAYIKAKKLSLRTYVVSNEDKTQTLYVVNR